MAKTRDAWGSRDNRWEVRLQFVREKTASTIRERHVWASLASHSLASGQSAELYQDLYAAAAQAWVDEGYSRLVEDPDVSVWIVEQAGQILSFQAYFPAEEDLAALLVPEKSVELGVAATRPDARGMGLNHVLTQKGLQHVKILAKPGLYPDSIQIDTYDRSENCMGQRIGKRRK